MSETAASASSSSALRRDASAGGERATDAILDSRIGDIEPPSFHGDETCATTSVVPAGYPSYCRQSRPCRSCLQKAGCMINPMGACVDQFSDRYSTWTNYSMAYKMDLVLPNATATNLDVFYSLQRWAFRAFEATYCSASDPVCQNCIAQNFWSPSSVPDSRFCVGKNGCICIFNCENHAYTSQVQCNPPTSAPLPTATAVNDDSEHKSLDSVIKFMILGMCVLLLLFAACLFRCIRKDYDRRRFQDRQRRVMRQARATVRPQRSDKLGVSALSLSGWQSFRQSLIDKEKQQVVGGDEATTVTSTDSPLSPSATPYVLSIDVDDALSERHISDAVASNGRPPNDPLSTAPSVGTSSDSSSHVSVQ